MRYGWFYNLWKAKMLYRNKRGYAEKRPLIRLAYW